MNHCLKSTAHNCVATNHQTQHNSLIKPDQVIKWSDTDTDENAITWYKQRVSPKVKPLKDNNLPSYASTSKFIVTSDRKWLKVTVLY